MDKKDVAAALEEMATLMELKGENPFRIRSFVNGARTIEALEEDLAQVVAEGRLRSIKGIGEALAGIIGELVATGESADLQGLRAEFPPTIFELFSIPGLGGKRIKQVYESLGVDSMEKLEAACRDDAIRPLKGMGAKMQAKILEGIEFARAHTGHFHYNKAEAQAEAILAHLRDSGHAGAVSVAGSLRRHKEVIKDIDLVATSDAPAALMDVFVGQGDVRAVTGHGETKSSVRLASGISVDLRVVSEAQYPFATLHFTGSKEHNVVLRQRAKERGLKLNEYGLFRDDDTPVPCESEEAVYRALDLPFIPPELREDRGEFSLASTPRLVERGDLRGLIHCHSTYSDGRHTLKEMATATRRLGYGYLVITDHSQSAGYAGGLKPDRVLEQQREIEKLNASFEGFRILSGIESDIRLDGSLDYEDDVLSGFDIIVASVHNKLDMEEKEATARTIKAIENPHTAILGHPTGRLLLSRKGFPLDWEKIFDACVANKVAVEINANCKRLDVDWRHIRQGRDKGVLFSIGPDAHSIEGLDNVAYGVGIARKGWLGPEHVINCWTAEELLAWRK